MLNINQACIATNIRFIMVYVIYIPICSVYIVKIGYSAVALLQLLLYII